jgi:hypothetical protein
MLTATQLVKKHPVLMGKNLVSRDGLRSSAFGTVFVFGISLNTVC